MKIKTVIKVLYISICVLTIAFNTLGETNLMLWAKTLVVPSIFWLYLLMTNFKIDFIKTVIFLSCYIGDIYRLLFPHNYENGQVLFFFLAYIFMLYYMFPSFIRINLMHKYNMILLIVTALCLSTLAYFILNLKFENMEIDSVALVPFGIVLEALMCIAIIEYSRKITLVTTNLLMLIIFFVFSDCFYILNRYYIAFFLFDFLQITTQVFSYYFLMNYFITAERENEFIKQ